MVYMQRSEQPCSIVLSGVPGGERGCGSLGDEDLKAIFDAV